MQLKNKKKIILQALAKVVKEQRGNKSQFMLAYENDMSSSIISTIERGLKDPQFTTLFKLAESFDMSVIDFIKLVVEKLPKDFSLVDK